MSQNNKITIGVIVSIALVTGIGGALILQSEQVPETVNVIPKQQEKPMLVDDQAVQNQAEIDQAKLEQVEIQDIQVTSVSYTYVEVSPREVIEQAKYALIGEIINLQPIRVDMPDIGDDDQVHTIVTFKVAEDLFGNYPIPTIQFRIEGGEASGLRMDVEDGTTFVIGQEVLVFIGMGEAHEYPFGAEHYLIAGPQSVFDYSDVDQNIQDRFLNKEYDREEIIKMVKKEKGSK